MEENYYIFTINDTEKEFTDRLTKGLWPVYSRTAYVKNLKKDDRVVFYKAGSGNHVFVGTSDVDSITDFDSKKFVKLKNIHLWKKSVNITKIFDKLSFIRNKYTYGVYLVNGIRKITKNDFESIISSVKK